MAYYCDLRVLSEMNQLETLEDAEAAYLWLPL